MERWHHVAVIGGGIAGLTAAIALAGHARRVTVVERDALAGDPGFRPGVPQSRHLHSLMGAGQRALDELLPGFTDELYAARRGAAAHPLRPRVAQPGGLVPPLRAVAHGAVGEPGARGVGGPPPRGKPAGHPDP
ncbi:FAD-dependent oxidoreductase [Actinomadura madurae]|uniref:FAD-dependent oxidoreductase n=1 Tax=Actinomadura madurae TaxID=1993 RepID=UPI0020D26115|nr:FAD-dependent oxidoreductase [Actinomadura madurae]MCP9972378.1 FAD-dependent oxidoreductase [Actinomadura madurae]MCQ0021077.1 FAD-dependent oxidoreductase [Actinomadura madurae]